MAARPEQWKRERKKRNKAVRKQQKAAASRARYGPSGKPAPVVVKRLDGSGKAVDQSSLTKRRYSDTVETLARAAGYASYDAYLRSTHWMALRRRVLERDASSCRLCGGKQDLRVHHDRYDVDLRSHEIGHLKTMCDRCHRRVHRR